MTGAITEFECQLGMPVTDALTRPASELVEMVLNAFPELIKETAIKAA